VILGCSSVAAVAVAADTYFSAQEGYLAQPPNYEGIGYMQFARTAYLLLRHLHLRAALHELDSITPLWTVLQTLQFFIVGDGTWQAFTVRFWPVALLLILVYWIVRARATREMAMAAVALTALLPMVSASVRASSWEFLSGQANYAENWGLDDLRPDFLAAVLILWSIASLAEHNRAPRRSAYMVSAAFAAAAVLTKPSTAPFDLAAWAVALGLMWWWRRGAATLRLPALAVSVLVILLIPWAVAGGGAVATISRLYEAAVTYRAAYSATVYFPDRLIYYLVRLPSQLGQIESAVVIIGSLFFTIVMLRRHLDRAEVMYAGFVAFFYVIFTIPANKDPNIGEWISLALWIFFTAAVARMAAARWSGKLRGASPAVLAAVGTYVLLVYSLGMVALANWPGNERGSYAQLQTVTAELAQELGRHLTAADCLTYAPGPGWPASIEYLLMDSNGAAPINNPIDVDPTTTTIDDYLLSAKSCRAVIVYREDVALVGQVFYTPAVRQPYLRALAEWVRRPDSGYTLDRTWSLADLAPGGPHTLGRYQGVSLTVDLYLRSPGT
jgi:4-amino-4-deoxy-L-arabinose transferase-like glycosyltransferase